MVLLWEKAKQSSKLRKQREVAKTWAHLTDICASFFFFFFPANLFDSLINLIIQSNKRILQLAADNTSGRQK
jgi:hypothetical protein